VSIIADLELVIDSLGSFLMQFELIDEFGVSKRFDGEITKSCARVFCLDRSTLAESPPTAYAYRLL
jgi:hypothetical protein